MIRSTTLDTGFLTTLPVQYAHQCKTLCQENEFELEQFRCKTVDSGSGEQEQPVQHIDISGKLRKIYPIYTFFQQFQQWHIASLPQLRKVLE